MLFFIILDIFALVNYFSFQKGEKNITNYETNIVIKFDLKM